MNTYNHIKDSKNEFIVKLLIIKSSKKSSWGSCQVISPNLHQMYQNLNENFNCTWHELAEDLKKDESESLNSKLYELNNKIENERPDKLVLVDHLPHPAVILSTLTLLKRKIRLPEVVIHVYGDFTHFSQHWLKLDELTKNLRLTLICASYSQLKMLNFFSKNNFSSKQLCFPFNTSEYYFDQNERDTFRKLNNVSNQDKILLYTGRISLQKNVDKLILEFAKINSKFAYHLWIVGGFDDVGADFLGFETYHGHMFAKIQKILNTLSPEIRSRIKFWDHQGKDKLRIIKNASDLYCSLSLYHDEDYGMSPAEALATGLPSLLTDWGGYSSFSNSEKWHCELLKVRLTETGHEINATDFQRGLQKIELLNIGPIQRKLHAENFAKKFSIKANVKNLENILLEEAPCFAGFNANLEEFKDALLQKYSDTGYNKKLLPSNENFYGKVYLNYISKDAEYE